MKLVKPIGIVLVVLAAQVCAFSAEVAVLRNGFEIRFDRKEQKGATTRLYTREGYLDIATSEIASFEHEDTPDVPVSAPATAVAAAPTTAGSVASLAPTAAPPTAPVALAAPKVLPAANRIALTPAELDLLIREASSRHQLDPDFVNSVIKAESNFKARAVSPKGAQGLMQLMPATASKLGVTDAFDPKANVEAGTAHLSALLDMYNNDPIKALAAYNAGAHRVEQYHGVPPYHETRAYVAKIVRDFNAKKRAQMNGSTSVANTTKKKKTSQPAQPQQAGVSKPQKPA
jgi:soluble lytic murein transglycosylase-like protein